MELSGIHILLTYRCNLECDHCFAWGSPWQDGTITLRKLEEILRQSDALGTVRWIYFEGGEPFLYYVLLERGVRMAAEHGFAVGIVSNGYWATSVDDARECLRPFAGTVDDLSLSRDLFHGTDEHRQLVEHARIAAQELSIPTGVISIAQPDAAATAVQGKLPEGESRVMYRGRAAEQLVDRVPLHPWADFTECPYEDLRDPGRVHVDPFGNVHICQGISIGNVLQTPLADLCAQYDPDAHPVVGPLLAGGPAELTRRYEVPTADRTADACHLCYGTRAALRGRIPATLIPPQMYGEFG